jgi:hypothetical protein
LLIIRLLKVLFLKCIPWRPKCCEDFHNCWVGKHLEGGDYDLNLYYASRSETQKYMRYSIIYFQSPIRHNITYSYMTNIINVSTWSCHLQAVGLQNYCH